MLISLGVIKNLPKPKEIAYLATEKEEISSVAMHLLPWWLRR